MNKARRKELKKAIEMIEIAKDIIEMCKDEEQDAFDNMPESIQESERGEAMEGYIYEMEDAIDRLDDVIDTIADDVISA